MNVTFSIIFLVATALLGTPPARGATSFDQARQYQVLNDSSAVAILVGNPNNFGSCTIQNQAANLCLTVAPNTIMANCRFLPNVCFLQGQYAGFAHVTFQVQGQVGHNHEGWVSKTDIEPADTTKSTDVGEKPCTDCGLTTKPSVNTLGVNAQEIKDKTNDPGSNSCSPPRTPQLVGAITKSRKKSGNACRAVTKTFYSSCSLLCEQSVEDRISYIADRIPKVIGEMPTQYADPRITPDLLLCIMKREDSDFDPTRISNNACNIGPSRASDFGLGQILLSTVVDYWHYYQMDKNPDFQDLVTKYKTPQNLYCTTPSETILIFKSE
jgi:hypothetical protein